MEDIKKLFLFLAIIALFTSGIAATVPAFADGELYVATDNEEFISSEDAE